MTKTMKLPFLFKAKEVSSSAWLWQACIEHPRTPSFRSMAINDDDHSEMSNEDDDSAAAIKRLGSDRLFFEPGETSSILEEAKLVRDNKINTNKVSIMAIESDDPVLDFRVSMEEMAEANGYRDWESLEELLRCYLSVNHKYNHGFIVEAFVDFLMAHFGASDDSSGNNSAIDEELPFSSSHVSSSLSASSDIVPYSCVSPLSYVDSSSSSSSASSSPSSCKGLASSV